VTETWTDAMVGVAFVGAMVGVAFVGAIVSEKDPS
jgi:hypothetical protein